MFSHKSFDFIRYDDRFWNTNFFADEVVDGGVDGECVAGGDGLVEFGGDVDCDLVFVDVVEDVAGGDVSGWSWEDWVAEGEAGDWIEVEGDAVAGVVDSGPVGVPAVFDREGEGEDEGLARDGVG